MRTVLFVLFVSIFFCTEKGVATTYLFNVPDCRELVTSDDINRCVAAINKAEQHKKTYKRLNCSDAFYRASGNEFESDFIMYLSEKYWGGGVSGDGRALEHLKRLRAEQKIVDLSRLYGQYFAAECTQK